MVAVAIGLNFYMLKKKTVAKQRKQRSVDIVRTGESEDDCHYDGLEYDEEERTVSTAPTTLAQTQLRRPSEVPEEYELAPNDQTRTAQDVTEAAPQEDTNAGPRANRIIKVNSRGDIYTEFGVYLQ